LSHNSFGKQFVVTCFGESHGRCVGVLIDGCPPGIQLSIESIQQALNKRKPSNNALFTPRREEDTVDILAGIQNNITTGAPLCMLVWNKNINSQPYEALRWTPRPGHADYPAHIRYHGFNDYRGGGRFSGRLTAAFVMAGAVAKQVLKPLGIEVVAHVTQIGSLKLSQPLPLDAIRRNVYQNPIRCGDPILAKQMEELIQDTRKKGDSIGGCIEGVAINVPSGVGHPIFDSLDADLAKALFNIPAVKGVEVGEGFQAAIIPGSQNNDPYRYQDGKIVTSTNHSGGILGGLTTGMSIRVRVAIKPTPSIAQPQQTVHLKDKVETTITIKGKHDACIVPRAVPAVESMIAITLTDHLLGLPRKREINTK
jgi:chorismate synthase